MSFTVGIHGSSALEGEICVKSFVDTSDSFRRPSSEKKAKGYIENEDGRTYVSVTWKAEDWNGYLAVRKALTSHKHKGYFIDAIPEHVVSSNFFVAKLMLKQADLSWIPELFKGIKSDFWLYYNTLISTSMRNYDQNTLPPLSLSDIASHTKKYSGVIYPVGLWGDYFCDDPETESYKQDARRIPFLKRSNHINEDYLKGRLMAESISKRNGDISKGIEATTHADDEVSGVIHGSTFLWNKDGNVTISYLKHEELSVPHRYVHDSEGNLIVAVGLYPPERFQKAWKKFGDITIPQKWQEIDSMLSVKITEVYSLHPEKMQTITEGHISYQSKERM